MKRTAGDLVDVVFRRRPDIPPPTPANEPYNI